MRTTANSRACRWRTLSAGEIALVEPLFGASLDYDAVRIHHRSYLPGQPLGTAMAPNGHIYYPYGSDNYQADFSAARYVNPLTGIALSATQRLQVRHVFIHELTHVWQHQTGERLRLRGLVLHSRWRLGRIGDPYLYALDGDRRFDDYNFEQRAEIIANYFLLRFHPHEADVLHIVGQCDQHFHAAEAAPVRADLRQVRARYEAVLSDFLADPAYRQRA